MYNPKSMKILQRLDELLDITAITEKRARKKRLSQDEERKVRKERRSRGGTKERK
jgi:hypothetical protein